LFGAPFVLAAVDFALRARISRLPRDFFASLLAASLMTGAKTSNLPLLLPWAIAIWPSLALIRRYWLPAMAVGLIALFASAMPILVCNAYYYHGDWAGLSAEGDNKKGNVALRTALNTTVMALQNLVPPVFPLANLWEQAVHHTMPAGLMQRLQETIVEPGLADFQLGEMQIEENAGMGLGVCLLLIFSVAAAAPAKGAGFFRSQFASGEALWLACLRWSPLVSLFALLSQSEVYPLARILAPYYPILLPCFLAGPAQEPVVGRRWWRALAGLVFLMAGMLLVVSPSRPLFPAMTIFSRLQAAHPESKALARAATVYVTYHDRPRAFAPALANLPPDLRILGLFTYDDPETSLWQPFGSRRIEHVRPDDTRDSLDERGIHYILIPPGKLETYFHRTPEDWVRSLNATVIKKIPLQLRIVDGTNDWWLVKLP
jgi:hypothetical protein